MPELIIEKFNDKSIVVRGNTKPYKEEIKKIGGLWNAKLTGGCGWIFPMSKKSIIEDLSRQIEEGSIKPEAVESKVYEKYEKKEDKNTVPMKSYLDLLARVERLEAIVSQVDFVKSMKNIKPKETADIVIEESEDEESEEEQKVTRMLRKK